MGAYLSEPETSKNITTGALGNVKFVCGEMQGWRKNMEDAVIHELDIGDGNSLFAVFDGHGGKFFVNVGPEVSKLVAEIFVNTLKEFEQYKSKDYKTALDKTFKKIDEIIESEDGAKKLREIRKKLQGGGSPDNSAGNISNGVGCTANVVLKTPTKYFIANAGDSRSALSRLGKLVVFSEDHKPQNQIEIDRIKKAGGTIQMGRVNGGLNLTRSFGDFDYKKNKSLGYDEQMITCKPDIRQVDIDANDQFIVVGCDGIWERFVDDSQKLLDLLKGMLSSKDHEKVLEDILNLLLAKNTNTGIGCDNMSIIIITLK